MHVCNWVTLMYSGVAQHCKSTTLQWTTTTKDPVHNILVSTPVSHMANEGEFVWASRLESAAEGGRQLEPPKGGRKCKALCCCAFSPFWPLPVPWPLALEKPFRNGVHGHTWRLQTPWWEKLPVLSWMLLLFPWVTSLGGFFSTSSTSRPCQSLWGGSSSEPHSDKHRWQNPVLGLQRRNRLIYSRLAAF